MPMQNANTKYQCKMPLWSDFAFVACLFCVHSDLQPQFTFSKSLLYIFGTNFPQKTTTYARLLAVLSTSLKVCGG